MYGWNRVKVELIQLCTAKMQANKCLDSGQQMKFMFPDKTIQIAVTHHVNLRTKNRWLYKREFMSTFMTLSQFYCIIKKNSLLQIRGINQKKMLFKIRNLLLKMRNPLLKKESLISKIAPQRILFTLCSVECWSGQESSAVKINPLTCWWQRQQDTYLVRSHTRAPSWKLCASS